MLLSSALAFTLVKYLGAAYLIYLGLRTLLKPAASPSAIVLPPQSLQRIFGQGVLVATLNPKTALFFVPLGERCSYHSPRSLLLAVLISPAFLLPIDNRLISL